MKRLFGLVAIVLAALCTATSAQNPGTVTNHAFVIGKGPGVAGYTSLLCGSGQLALGSATDPTCRTVSGDAALSATGVLTLASVNGNVGTFGSAAQCTTVTYDAKGRATAVSAVTCTPAISSVTGLGTGVASALALNVGSAGAPVVFNGAGGTPSALTLTNATGLPTTGLTGTLQAAQEPAHTGDVTNSAGSLALAYTNVVPAAKGGAGTINGALKGNGSGVVSQAACADLSNATAWCSASVAAWGTYTPSLSCNSGTFTSASAAGRFLTVGKVTFLNINITITTNGSCANFGTVSLPATPNALTFIGGRSSNGNLVGGAASGTNLNYSGATGLYVGGDGTTVTLSGSYENQ